MATLGLIGSGNIGGTLARLAADAGLDVVLSNSRGPQTLSALAAELGPRARPATPAEAAAAGDWVIVTIPLSAIGTVPRQPLADQTVIDTGHYFAPRDATIPELEAQELTDSEILQRHLPEAHVVKAFNNIHHPHLRALPRPAGAADRTTCRSPATTRPPTSTPPSCSHCSATTAWTWDRSPKAGAHKWAPPPSARPTRPPRTTSTGPSKRDWDVVKRDVKLIYTAVNAAAARAALDELAEKRGKQYGAVIRLWENAWEQFIPFLDYDLEIRTVICSTNAIESLNARYRRAVKARGHFPTEQAAIKCLYLVTRSLDPTGDGRTKWTMRWKPALNAFAITFADRFPSAETY